MRVILATRPTVWAQAPDRIVIDHGNGCFWRDFRRWPKPPVGRASFGNDYGVRFRIFTALLVRMPNFVPWADLIDFVWGEDEDGGPMQPRNSVWVRLNQSTDGLAFLGVEPFNVWNCGAGFRPIS